MQPKKDEDQKNFTPTPFRIQLPKNSVQIKPQPQVKSVQFAKSEGVGRGVISKGEQMTLNYNQDTTIIGIRKLETNKWVIYNKVQQNINVRQPKHNHKFNHEDMKKFNTGIKAPQEINQPQTIMSEQNVNAPKINSTTEIYGKIGGAVGGTVGSILTDIAVDGYDNVDIKKAVVIGAFGSMPYVGIAFQVAMAGVAIGGITLSQYITTRQKWHQLGVLSSKVGISAIACYSSIELGMALGVAGGPVGVVTGGIVGGLFGGIVSNLCGRKIDDITQKPFSMEIKFNDKNKSVIRDGYLENSGVNPQCIFENVQGTEGSIILIAITEKHQVWVLPNIRPKENKIIENCKRGLILHYETGSTYLGPDNSEKEITFTAYRIKENYVNDGECIKLLNEKKLTILCVAEQKITL